MYSYEPLHMAEQKQDDQHEHAYSSYVRIRDVTLKTCQRRWTIGRSGERESGISVLTLRHDDDDDEFFVVCPAVRYTTIFYFVVVSNVVLVILSICISQTKATNYIITLWKVKKSYFDFVRKELSDIEVVMICGKNDTFFHHIILITVFHNNFSI